MEAEEPRVATEAMELPSGLRDALIETLSDPFQTRVYATVNERPSVTIAQIAARVGEWKKLADILERMRAEIEETVIRSAALLEASGLGGTEVVAALILFETPAWWGRLVDDPPVFSTLRSPTVGDPGPIG
jgi:hypothetical protein